MTDRGARLSGARLAWFVAVGLSATLVYFFVALALTYAAFPSAVSSLAAFGVSSAISYAGHRGLTFRTNAPHLATAPRFTGWVVLQSGLALIVPAILTDVAGLPAAGSFVAVCILMPVLSLLVLSRFVFATNVERASSPPVAFALDASVPHHRSHREVRHG